VALELDGDPGERVFEPVPEFDEFVIDAGDPRAKDDDQGDDNTERDEGCGDGSG